MHVYICSNKAKSAVVLAYDESEAARLSNLDSPVSAKKVTADAVKIYFLMHHLRMTGGPKLLL